LASHGLNCTLTQKTDPQTSTDYRQACADSTRDTTTICGLSTRWHGHEQHTSGKQQTKSHETNHFTILLEDRLEGLSNHTNRNENLQLSRGHLLNQSQTIH
jgi:hypothetical protein